MKYCKYLISIHAAREGGDLAIGREFPLLDIFQSTPPVKAATLSVFPSVISAIFQSTPPVKAATGNPAYLFSTIVLISIHAAREGGDVVGSILS